MEEEKLLELARKSLARYHLAPLKFPAPGTTNYDVFRKHVSNSFLTLFKMSKARSNKRTWENGVNLAPRMQAIFQRRTKPQSSKHAHSLEKYEGKSRKLAGVIDHVATQAFASLPPELQGLSCKAIEETPTLRKLITKRCTIGNPTKNRDKIVLPVSLGPCLKYYSIISQEEELREYFRNIILNYFDDFKKPRVCELCQCWTHALTAHHLVPRSVQRHAAERRWTPAGGFDSIARLCRGCHESVHRILVPEALAANYWTVQLLLTRTEIWQYAQTIRKLVHQVN